MGEDIPGLWGSQKPYIHCKNKGKWVSECNYL